MAAKLMAAKLAAGPKLTRLFRPLVSIALQLT